MRKIITEVDGFKISVEVGEHKGFPVLKFWNVPKKEKPSFTLGRWELAVILSQIDDVRKFAEGVE